VADGDVVVWGHLRGTVHAGAAGDSSAVVCALDLSPTQLRIADHIATSPARRGESRPEIARIRDGQIVAERWTGRGK
jgi:septum site-determining protein MinC